MRNFPDTFETRKRSFVSAFSICMTVPSSQCREAADVFNSQFVPNKQYNFFYSDSFQKLNMQALSNYSFLTFIYVFNEVISSKLSTLLYFC